MHAIVDTFNVLIYTRQYFFFRVEDFIEYSYPSFLFLHTILKCYIRLQEYYTRHVTATLGMI